MEDDRVVEPSAESPRQLLPTPQGTPIDDDHLMHIPPPPGSRNRDPLATYVVQVPKDQIYRIPPPENAGIVERHREQAKAKKNKSNRRCSTYLIWITAVLFAIGFIVGGTLLAIYFIFTPKAPSFTVSKLSVKQPKRGSPTFDVALRAKNPNEKMGIEYKKDGDGASLLFSNKNLGYGDFPSLKQKVGVTSNVDIKIHGLKNKPVPADVKKSIHDKKKKHPISLKLKFEPRLVFDVWIFKLWKRGLRVNCDVKVNTMAEGSKIVSQHCKTNMS